MHPHTCTILISTAALALSIVMVMSADEALAVGYAMWWHSQWRMECTAPHPSSPLFPPLLIDLVPHILFFPMYIYCYIVDTFGIVDLLSLCSLCAQLIVFTYSLHAVGSSIRAYVNPLCSSCMCSNIMYCLYTILTPHNQNNLTFFLLVADRVHFLSPCGWFIY